MTTKNKQSKNGVPIPLEELAAYRGRGLSYTEIAKIGGVSKQAIFQRCKAAGIDPVEVEQFRKDRPAILAVKQKMLLNSIDQEAVNKMAPRDRVLSYGILQDKEERLTGRSGPGNINLVLIAEKIEARDLKRFSAPREVDVTPAGEVCDES